jgi:hypothetical protein
MRLLAVGFVNWSVFVPYAITLMLPPEYDSHLKEVSCNTLLPKTIVPNEVS